MDHGATPQTYMTLDGRVLDLAGLGEEERAYLVRCLEAYRRGIPWAAFCRLVETTENPLLRPTSGWITQPVWEHPLFRAVRDLSYRLGIQQGKIAPGPDDDPQRDPVVDEWIPAAEAACRVGVSLPGLRKAVARGQILARPTRGGRTRWVVSANSLRSWSPSRVRQAAGRRVRTAARA